MRVAFFGTSDFSVAVLAKLVRFHEVIAIVSQPNRLKDRKNRLIPTPASLFAEKNNIPVFQFERVKSGVNELKAIGADIFVTAAYGQILSKEILDIPPYGVINVHASLLPSYRGSSPIQSAILNGDDVTGVSIMKTNEGMDTGDVLLSQEVAIGEMTAGELSEKLAEKGGDLLIETLKRIGDGTIEPVKQDEKRASHCKKILSGDEKLDLSLNARDIYNKIRAFNPTPIAYTTLNGERLKVLSATLSEGDGDAGEVIFCDKAHGLIVACGKGALRLNAVQPASKKVMSDLEFINGKKIKVGDHLGK